MNEETINIKDCIDGWMETLKEYPTNKTFDGFCDYFRNACLISFRDDYLTTVYWLSVGFYEHAQQDISLNMENNFARVRFFQIVAYLLDDEEALQW